MSPIQYAIAQIRYRIPEAILIEVFAPKTYLFRQEPIGWQEQVLNRVLRARVMTDCDLVGGTEVIIPLGNAHREVVETDMLATVYHIPKSMTGGRTITSVLSLSYASKSMIAQTGMVGMYDPCSVTEANIAGRAMIDAMSGIPMVSTAKVQLIGENTVLVRNAVLQSASGNLRCILSNDENLSHLQVRSYPAFARLCELAVKSYIYNEYSIILDRARIEGGAEIGRFKEIVDSYSDAEEMYQEYIKTVWQKTAFMNDRESFERFTRMMTGTYR